MKLTGAFVKSLENEEVEYIFGIVGTETIDFIHSLSSSSIQHIVVRHEQGASFMADVYGRLSGKAGVCTATLGPGATNLMTGIASAYLDHSPLVAITGQAGLERVHQQSHQYIDVVQMMKPITKWNIQVKEPLSIHEIVRKAFMKAQSKKPGPVHIELPKNLSNVNIEGLALQKTKDPCIAPANSTIEHAVTQINNSKKPFIIVGNGVVREQAWEELRQFAEKLSAPVANTFMAKGILPLEHPLNMFTFGFKHDDYVVNGLRESDLIITIGFDFVESQPKDWNLDKKPILHIDTEQAEVDGYYPVSVEAIGDIKETLNLLLITESLVIKEQRLEVELRERIKQANGLVPAIGKKEEQLTPKKVLQTLGQFVKNETILIADVGKNKMEVARYYQPKLPNRVIITNGFASMGIAVPGAIGAKLACPDDPVVCITGDGGFMMNMAEIETAKRLGLSFVIVVFRDEMLALEYQTMNKKHQTSYGTTYTDPDFIKLAESFGVKGLKVSDISELEPILNQALNEGGIVLVEIPVKYDFQ